MAILSWLDRDGSRERRLDVATRIGRSPENDIRLLGDRVSWFHARITDTNGTWVFEDNNSSNGSFVNGESVNRCQLHDGDVIRIGNVSLTFRMSSAATVGAFPSEKGTLVESAAGDKGFASHQTAANVEAVFHDEPDVARIGAVSSVVTPPSAEPSPGMDPRALALRLKASYEISKATAATLDLSVILDRVLTALFEIFETAERSLILLVDATTHEVNARAVKRRTPDGADEIAISRTALEGAMRNREAVLCTDAMTDQRYAGAKSILDLRIRSMMIAPLVFHDEVLGAIHMDTRSAAGQFTQADLELLSVAAAHVAACVANAELHGRVVASERLAAVGQTLAGLTHCIKNVLQGVQGGAFILDKALQDGNVNRVKTGWEMVKRNNTFMEELVFDLLSYSKRRAPEYETAELNAICSGVCDLAVERAQLKGVAVTFTPDPALPPVEIDPKGIRRCLLNLVMNAVDACANSGGAVTVGTRAPAGDGLVRLRVRDTGCGMSEETKAKLFTAFFSTKGSKGTGLGLPVTHKIVEEHGGRIEVESQEGKGTTFTICLPRGRIRKQQKGVPDDS